MSISVHEIEEVAKTGDIKRAQAMLKVHLKESPSADGWVMACRWTKNRDAQIQYLRKALAIDEWHTEANRLLYRLEGSEPKEVVKPRTDWDKQTGMKAFRDIDRSKSRDLSADYKDRQRLWTQFGCMFGVVLMFFTSVFTFRAVGLLSVGNFSGIFGWDAPVTEIGGVPLAESEEAIYQIAPAVENEASNQDMEIMDAGYLHQHNFEGFMGEQYAIFVQFLSFSANQVSRNVAIISPNNTDITGRCEKTSVVQSAGDTGVAYICTLPMTGRYAVRILGRDGESVGAYFIGVEKLAF